MSTIWQVKAPPSPNQSPAKINKIKWSKKIVGQEELAIDTRKCLEHLSLCLNPKPFRDHYKTYFKIYTISWTQNDVLQIDENQVSA
jgi:hypothetical protein